MMRFWRTQYRSGGVVCAMVLIACMLGACGGSYLPEKYLYKARKIAQDVKLDAATPEQVQNIIAAFRVVTTKWPLSEQAIVAHYTIAEVHVARKEYPAAIEELERIILNFSRSGEAAPEAQFTIGLIWEQAGDLDKALSAYQKIRDLYPLSRKGLYVPLYTAELLKKHKKGDAIVTAAYAKALEAYGGHLNDLGEIKEAAIVQNYIALTYASQDKWQEALANWDVLLKKYPESNLVPATLMTMAEVYFVKQKERTKAVECYQTITKRYPQSTAAVRAMMKMIELYFVTNMYTEVVTSCHTLVAMMPKNKELVAQTKMIEARATEKSGSWAQAEVLYHTILSDYADTTAALRVPIFLAEHYAGEKNTEQVSAIYETAMKEYESVMSDMTKPAPVRQSAFDLMNFVNAQQGNWDRVIATMDGIISSSNVDPNRAAQALYIKAFIYHRKLNNLAKAKELYNQFRTLYPKHPFIRSIDQQLAAIASGVAEKQPS